MNNSVSAPQRLAAGNKESLYIPSLDGIRAMSFMIVFLAHAGLGDIIPGGFGVTVFFFLSGYLITTLLRMEIEKTGKISLKLFYLRRVLRIFPPFYLVLVLATLLALAGLLPGTLQSGAIFFQAVHLSNYQVIIQGWDGRAGGTAIYWSLAVEEHFYLCFPLLYFFLYSRFSSSRQQVTILLAICAIALAWRCFLVYGLHVAVERTYLATDTRLDSILFGCILAIFCNPVLDKIPVAERWWKQLLFPLGIAGLLISFAVRDVQFQESFRYTLQGLSLFPLFIVAIQYPNWGIIRVLNIGWVRFLGVLSYSLYLIHQVMLSFVGQWVNAPGIIKALLALAISIGLATLIYHFIEKPCAQIRKRLTAFVQTRQAFQRDMPALTPLVVLSNNDPAGHQRQ